MKGLRGLTAKKLSEVYCDTEIEPTIVLLSGEDLSNRTTNRSSEANLMFKHAVFGKEDSKHFLI